MIDTQFLSEPCVQIGNKNVLAVEIFCQHILYGEKPDMIIVDFVKVNLIKKVAW